MRMEGLRLERAEKCYILRRICVVRRQRYPSMVWVAVYSITVLIPVMGVYRYNELRTRDDSFRPEEIMD